MVAQVIKLPSVATNNFQSRPSGNPVEVVKAASQNAQLELENVQAKKTEEQESQNTKAVRDAAKVLNEFVQKIQTNLNFSVDEDSGRSVITVTDTQTGDVIRQIPAKEVLAVANLIREATESDAQKVGLLLAEQG
jgi:flagellar protein FlaG